MLSNAWTLRSKHRVLEISGGGRWYIGFTLALGVAAVYSGNNVIYLLESLLLSTLLVSGVLSELTLSRVSVTRVHGNIHAGRAGEDLFVVQNHGRLPLYCIELGEYKGKAREFTSFLLMLPGHSEIRVRSQQVIAERGRHYWDGLVVGTSFPFGFARKVGFLPDAGSRIVWPAARDPGPPELRDSASLRGELEVVAGEVTEVEPWQDASRIHWPVSARAGKLMARPLRWIDPREEVWLDILVPGEGMEMAISRTAGSLERRADTLVILDRGERRRIEGKRRALDTLALLPKAPCLPPREESA